MEINVAKRAIDPTAEMVLRGGGVSGATDSQAVPRCYQVLSRGAR